MCLAEWEEERKEGKRVQKTLQEGERALKEDGALKNQERERRRKRSRFKMNNRGRWYSPRGVVARLRDADLLRAV